MVWLFYLTRLVFLRIEDTLLRLINVSRVEERTWSVYLGCCSEIEDDDHQ